jgi:hypothetical protein
MFLCIMGASHSVEAEAPLREIEDPEPETDSEPESEEVYEQEDDIRWLWPFI